LVVILKNTKSLSKTHLFSSNTQVFITERLYNLLQCLKSHRTSSHGTF